MKSCERLAVIDLGSNSFRLVVFTATEGWWQRSDEIYQVVRIGEGMAATGRLGEEPMHRALATLDVFAHFCEAAGLSMAPTRDAGAKNGSGVVGGEKERNVHGGVVVGGAVDAVATSAIRDAENAPAFLAKARERTKLPIRVLSREQEAHYGYLAAVNSTTLRDGCMLDLGGGSMQLVGVRDRGARESGSWRVGAVRMTERFLPNGGPAKPRQIEALREHVAQELRERGVAGEDRQAPGRDRRDGAQPRRRGAARGRAAEQRRAGHDRDARGARGDHRAAGGAGALAARERAGGEAGASGPDPGGSGRGGGRVASGWLRRPGGDRGGTARGGVLRASSI